MPNPTYGLGQFQGDQKKLQELNKNLKIFPEVLTLADTFINLTAIDAGRLTPQALCRTLYQALEGLQKSGVVFEESRGPEQVIEALTRSAPLQDRAWRARQPGVAWLPGCRPGRGAVLNNYYIGAAVAKEQRYLQRAIFLLHAVAHQNPEGGIFDPPRSNRGACGNHWYTTEQGQVAPTGVCSTGAPSKGGGQSVHSLVPRSAAACLP